MPSDRIRVTVVTALSMRFMIGSKATTSDLIALLSFLDLDDAPRRWESHIQMGVGMESIATEARIRRMAGVTSGPGFERMLERLRECALLDPDRSDKNVALYPIRGITHYRKGDISDRSRIIAELDPYAVACYGVNGDETAFALDPAILRGLTLPSAMLMLRWLAVQYMPYEIARDTLRGLVGLKTWRAGVSFDVKAEFFALGFAGRWIVREHRDGLAMGDSEEFRRTLHLARREFKERGLKLQVERPAMAQGRSPVKLTILGGIEGHERVTFDPSFVAHVPVQFLNPVAPKPVADPQRLQARRAHQEWLLASAAALPPPGAGSDLDHGVYYE